MKPILFSENSTTFTSNGIGRLSDAISCFVTEERNGLYELEIEYPLTGKHFSDIGVNSIIVVKPCDGGSLQPFRVYMISKPINGRVTINARHICYQLSNIPAMPFSVSASAQACAQTLAALKANAAETCPFTFWTDVTTAAAYSQLLPASINSRLRGVEGSVLDQFGGEYEFDNYTVKLHRQRGRINTGITLRYGKNITDITQEENIAGTITGICPYWSDTDGNEVVTLPEKVVYSQYAANYPFHLTEVHDFTQLFEEKPTVSSLRSAAETYVSQENLGVPKVSIEVSFVALWQTEEYKDIAPLERVQLCDEITVDFVKLGISRTAKVVRTEYDVLTERYRSIQIGEIRSSLTQALTDRDAATVEAIDFGNQKVYREANATAADAINNATQWLTGSNGYVVAVKDTNGTWKELLFMDTNNTQTATNVLRINTNGIGFSTHGITGPYTNAWTIDGNLVASFIKTGILSDLAGKFSLNMTTGALNMQDGTFEGTINSSTVNGSTINGTTINVGTFNGADGTVNIYANDGVTILYTLTKNGLISYAKSQNGQIEYEISYAKSGYTQDAQGNTYFSPSLIEYKVKNSSAIGCIGLRGDGYTPGILVKSFSGNVNIEGNGIGIGSPSGDVTVLTLYGNINTYAYNGEIEMYAKNDITLSSRDGSIKFDFADSYSNIIVVGDASGGGFQDYYGYTGTRNGLKFVKGICVGTA